LLNLNKLRLFVILKMNEICLQILFARLKIETVSADYQP